METGSENDLVLGGGGDDLIASGADDDTVHGGAANDLLVGGPAFERGFAGSQQTSDRCFQIEETHNCERVSEQPTPQGLAPVRRLNVLMKPKL